MRPGPFAGVARGACGRPPRTGRRHPLAGAWSIVDAPRMPELILHHYDMSPYAEKIRLALGWKGLPWRSVITPTVLPKPDHFELTGGYRRVPVLQVGADVYCDTHLIARVLDRIQPSRPLAPPAGARAGP